MSTDIYPKVTKRRRLNIKLPWKSIIGTIVLVAALSLFVAHYYKSTFVGLTDRHAFDVAQIAKNISKGKGFTTRIIRPFNVGLIESTHRYTVEINTAPAYPYAVAALFHKKGSSDQGIIWVSLFFLILTIISTGLLGWLIFDLRVGLLAMSVVGVSGPVIDAGASGTEWTMAAFLFTLLLFSVLFHHRAVSNGRKFAGIAYVITSAIIIAALFMTNHILVFLLIPLALHYAFTGPSRRLHTIVFIVAALILIAPWAYRYASLAGGSIIAANAWDIFSNSKASPGDVFVRSSDQSQRSIFRALLFPLEHFNAFSAKLIAGTSALALASVPMLGLAILPMVVVSVLYKFDSESGNIVRRFIYAAVIILTILFAVFSVDTRSIILFAPIVGIFGSAYFFKVMTERNLHPVYVNLAIGAVILASCWPSLAEMMVRRDAMPRSEIVTPNEYFVSLNAGGLRGVVYTDQPWLAAWRMDVTAVWLPQSDDDVVELTSAGFPMRVIIMTPAVEDYPPAEIWYLVHRSKLWRDYIRDPDACMEEFQRTAEPPQFWFERFQKYMKERRRTLALSRSISGFVVRDAGIVRALPGQGWGATPYGIIVMTGVTP
ncbi:MAG: glycosyltransferase family 39 protein [Armatimonadetes bacterium]|nr:glycosyltransferase family 39 protein [Armatimonadota bacterium]